MEGHHCCWTNINVVPPPTHHDDPVSLIKDFFHHKNYWMFPYTYTTQKLPRYNSTFTEDICNAEKTNLLGQKTIQTSKFINFTPSMHSICQFQWPRGLRHRCTATRLLRLWVRMPSGAWMFLCCECCVLSGRGLCDELITRPEESYQLWCITVCDLETSWMRRPWPSGGLSRQKQTNKQTHSMQHGWMKTLYNINTHKQMHNAFTC
jgi:hypothetical protein